jgi:hypothetical protein
VTVGITGPTPVRISGPASAALKKDGLTALAVAEATDEDHLPALLDEVIGQFTHDTRIWLVSTRETDLDDQRRFPGLHAGRHRQLAASGISAVSTGSPEFADYFRVE